MKNPVLPNGQVPGDQPTGVEPGLRLVFFGLSIVSDWENPAASSHRAFLQALAGRGHQVVFLEERRNAPTVGLLKQRGSAPLKAFDRHYPDVPHRTYDLPPARELDVWLGREASTADAIIAFEGTHSLCLEGLLGLDAGHALKLIERQAAGTAPPCSTELFAPSAQVAAMPYAPVIDTSAHESLTRDIEVLLVAYDDRELALGAAAVLSSATAISAGSALIPELPFVPEVELPGWYRRAGVTAVVDEHDPDRAPVRPLLPLASGSAAVLVTPHELAGQNWPFLTSTIEQLPVVSRQAADRGDLAIPGNKLEPFSAAERASALELLVREHQR